MTLKYDLYQDCASDVALTHDLMSLTFIHWTVFYHAMTSPEQC
jgi:hypothetical protein